MAEDRLWEDGPDSPTSIFRPSYSATTLYCVGSLAPSIGVQDTAGREAAVGTVFHEFIAQWQLDGEQPDYLLGRVRKIDEFEVTIDDEMFSYAEECLEHYSSIPGDRYVETKIDISDLTPIKLQSGTSDLYILRPGVLEAIDWKYGKGVKVFAKDNTQLLCYAWGIFKKHDSLYHFKTIRLHIAQPRLGHYEVWEISRNDLIAYADWIRDRWYEAWTKTNPSRTPGPKQCLWCKIRTRCAARQAHLEAVVDATFDILDEVTVSAEAQQKLVVSEPADVNLTAAVELDTARLAWIYQYRGMIERWFKDIGEELLQRGMRGDDLGGLWKISRARPGRRRWRDQEEAIEALAKLGIPEERIYERKLISPRAAEQELRSVRVRGKLGKQYVNLHINRSEGRLTLVPVGDNRASLTEIVDDTFDVEEDEL